MNRIPRPHLVPVLLAAALAGCDSTQTVPENERFAATLSGGNEVPAAISTPATGVAEFEALPDGSVAYTIDVQNMTGIIMGHIHAPADASRNAGIVVWLHPPGARAPGTPTGTVSGELVRGTFRAADVTGMSMDSLLTLLRTGNAYVNVHTSANPAGEIRGQVNLR